MQCIVVQKMARDLNFHTKIVVCPTLREPNGLAMSTRNMYLSDSEREKVKNESKESIESKIERNQTKERESLHLFLSFFYKYRQE
jgi:pantoate--beta-alanine ligase